MSTSRRDFLKTSIIAGAGATLPALPAFAAQQDAAPATGEISSSSAIAYTRGIGLYPGLPSENFSPSFVIDSSTYRNLALHRPAWHSSSYDYNLTAQLVTDGIKDTQLPAWVATSIDSRGPLPKNERELFLDHFAASVITLKGPSPSAQVQLGGGVDVPVIDRLEVFATIPKGADVSTLSITILTSDDGRVWQEMGKSGPLMPLTTTNFPPDLVADMLLFKPSIVLKEASRSRHYKIQFHRANAENGDLPWGIGDTGFYRGETRVQIGGPYSFTSAWMGAGLSDEWVYVDLGASCEFDRIALYWIARAAEGSIQVSEDAITWRDVRPLPDTTALVDDLRLTSPVHGRYVRVFMTRAASASGYILSELEVYGRGGPVPKAIPAAVAEEDGRLNLAGGDWQVQRSTLVSEPGEVLSKTGYKESTQSAPWLVATVPGTVLTSYLNAGAIPDPNFGQNQLHISDSYFYSDFWYRTEFLAPPVDHGEVAWLNFDGINWKADIFLNGEKIGRMEGGFIHARFDVTGRLQPGRQNALAVRIEKNATPGSAKQKTWESPGKNGGALGADNPTYHASIGWDWIPTIRGRNTGIWGDVSITKTGAVTIEHPYVTTTLPLPDISRADIGIEVDLVNHSAKPIAGTLRGRFGDVQFQQRVTIESSSTRKIKLDPSSHPALRLQKPDLWWPVGYGEPHLYDVELAFVAKGHKPSDTKRFKAGIRQMAFNNDGGNLRLFINGRRFIARGGNWGFGESMLRYRAREYDAAVRYHHEMNFTMIRNWVGQIGDEAFYEACDRHGVMVWQDFWLANPYDGPIPNDNALFMSNVNDLILRIRNHASIGLYCGRNEGFPPAPLEAGIEKSLAKLHPAIHYIGSSADDVVSGHGPYRALPPTYYFRNADKQLHSEIGMPNIPPIESVRAMMPASALWPQALDWGLHDFNLTGAQGGSSFLSIIEESYGGADNAAEWVTLAQFVNYEGYRAMFEAQSKYRMGLLLWMSHPCWPSFVWQTYDYYFEPTAAYFGCKKASEPIHIQWNRDTEAIEVVNYSAGKLQGLSAQVEVFNMDGSKVWSKTASVDSEEDSTTVCIPMRYPAGLSPVHFLRLTLTRGDETLSSNFYLRGLEEGNYRAVRELPKARIAATTSIEQKGDLWLLTTQLHNTSATPALMVRLIAVRETTGDRILPAIYSDNYVTLMPGEKRSLLTELNHRDTRNEKPRIAVGGFNTASA